MAITIEQAVDLVFMHTPILEEEWAPLLEAAGRVLTQDVCAQIVQPPFDRSPLDGYALIAADSEGASQEAPVSLRIVDKLYAGSVSRTPVLPGQAVRLMTGSMIPAGADCVLRQEDTDGGEAVVQIYKPVKAGSNYCHRGEEYSAGAQLIAAGRKVDAAAIAVAAGAGLTKLPVHRRMRVAVVATGDEVQQPGSPLAPGKIYDSNTSYLLVRLAQLGTQITMAASVGDGLSELVSTFERASGEADLVLTTGGVSVGQKDLTEQALREFGADIIFHGIAIKPGMPTLFARKGRCLFLGLSGNPFSAAVPFELLLRPMLAKMAQDSSIAPKRERVYAGSSFHKHSPIRRFLRAYCCNGQVLMPLDQSNGQMRGMIGCNCLIDIPAGTEEIQEGEQVEIVWT